MLTNETPGSSSTSSYSSAKTTPKSSPLNRATAESNEHKSPESQTSADNDLRNSYKKSNGSSKRSASDDAVIAIQSSTTANSRDKPNHERSRSDCDDLIETTKARMNHKFDQLEDEAGLKLWTKTRQESAPNERREETIDELSDGTVGRDGSAERARSLSISEVKEQAFNRMRCELSRAQNELKLKDEEVAKLSRIRLEVEAELEDLTASLFAEANDMVYNANVLRAKAQKELYEANLKIDVLQAEVQALKLLVLTSTPSNHSSVRVNGVKGVKGLLNKPKANASLAKKSPSNYELGGSAADKLDAIAQNDVHNCAQNALNSAETNDVMSQEVGEVDPSFHEEFLEWKKSPHFEPMNSEFIKRIYDEEIYPVFNFKDKDLTAQVLRAIEDNTIIIEMVADKSPFPKRCALLDAPRSCRYRMKIDDNWHNISQLCRNRIIAVCDLFCYLRYIERGLVKSSFHDVYWEVIRRRRNIALSRLGFSAF